ncbi:MAG TPA: TraR/DksA C4-type zinc finger protein [Actinomycetota bacterium]|nr:TraR/DksA C4-type zinc finger protein [Actinomycetota bacterium]
MTTGKRAAPKKASKPKAPARAAAKKTAKGPAKKGSLSKLVKTVKAKASGAKKAVGKPVKSPVRAGKTASKPVAATKTAAKKVAPKGADKKKAAPAKKAAPPVQKQAGKPAAGLKGAKSASKPAAPAKAQEAPAVKPAATKIAPPAPPPKEAPKKPRKPELTPREIASIRETLLVQRETLTKEASDIEDAAFNSSQSDMSGEVSFDEEYADAGSFTFEREKELSIGNNIRDLLDKVDHAIASIDRGTYGLCENCGDPINKERLRALPYSALCIRCKQQEERTR